MKKFFVLLVSVASLNTLYAQIPGGPPGGARGGGQAANIGRFYGKIVDDKNKGLEAASVQLIMNKMDQVTKQRKDTVISGMLTRANGDFSLEQLPIFGQYKLVISAIGYKSIEQKVAFEMKMGQGQDMSQALAAVDKDLGNIKMEQDPKLMEAVTVTGSRPMIEMGIDRKIFNVEKNINAAGGTAVDVMRQVPSINVDIEGNVTLRNAAPQIFVDGRPTTLTLEQIPADAIQSIEIITNPSAKFDASGGQSGILNIVLKKNRKAGYNGSIRAGIDSRARINAGGDLNVRQGKFNFFANGMYNQRKSKGWGETDRVSTIKGNQVITLQDNDNISRGAFAFGRFGIDYFIDNRNTITLSQVIVDGDFNFDNRNALDIDTVGVTKEYQAFNTLGNFHFRNYGSQLSFKHLFARAGKEWTADVNFNKSRNTNLSDISTRAFNDPAHTSLKNEFLQALESSGENQFLVAQTDFVNPINENMKWDAGARAQIRRFQSFQRNSINGDFKPDLSNAFDYTDYVYAGYVTFSQKVKDKFNYQLGLRAESSSYDGDQIGKDHFSNSYPISLFPSVFITRNFKDRQDIQLNYSRRVNRPNFFQLMPNTDYSDKLNYQTGNPDLRPEFTHSLELSYQKTYGNRNNTFLVTLFGKYTDDLISRYQNRGTIGGSADSAFITTWVNANSAYASGLELVLRHNWTKWWDMTTSSNIYYSKIKGDNVADNLENERTSWSAKTNNTFKGAKGWSIQLSGDYIAKSALPVSTSNSVGGRGGGGGGGFFGGSPSTTQGYIDANYGVDLGIRKEFQIKKNTATISVNWSDILRTRKYVVHSEAVGFIQDDWRRRDPQMVRVNFSYRFGKFDVALFKRKNLRGEGETMQNGMQGMQQ